MSYATIKEYLNTILIPGFKLNIQHGDSIVSVTTHAFYQFIGEDSTYHFDTICSVESDYIIIHIELTTRYISARQMVIGKGSVKSVNNTLPNADGDVTLNVSYSDIVMPDNSKWNGVSGGSYRINFIVPASGWSQAETGRYTQTVAVDGITTHTNCYYLGVDMSAVTEETIDAVKKANSCIDIVETVNGGIMFTAFKSSPTIDLNMIADVAYINTVIPNASGVSF